MIKVSGDRLIIMDVTTAITSVLALPILFYLPLPARELAPSYFIRLSLISFTDQNRARILTTILFVMQWFREKIVLFRSP